MVAALRCARAVRRGNDVTADSLAADYANNVIEDFRRAEKRSETGGGEKRRTWPRCGTSA